MDKIEFLTEESKLTAELLDLATELDARETSFNSVISGLHGVSWIALCDRGIEILTKLRG